MKRSVFVPLVFVLTVPLAAACGSGTSSSGKTAVSTTRSGAADAPKLIPGTMPEPLPDGALFQVDSVDCTDCDKTLVVDPDGAWTFRYRDQPTKRGKFAVDEIEAYKEQIAGTDFDGLREESLSATCKEAGDTPVTFQFRKDDRVELARTCGLFASRLLGQAEMFVSDAALAS